MFATSSLAGSCRSECSQQKTCTSLCLDRLLVPSTTTCSGLTRATPAVAGEDPRPDAADCRELIPALHVSRLPLLTAPPALSDAAIAAASAAQETNKSKSKTSASIKGEDVSKAAVAGGGNTAGPAANRDRLKQSHSQIVCIKREVASLSGCCDLMQERIYRIAEAALRLQADLTQSGHDPGEPIKDRHFLPIPVATAIAEEKIKNEYDTDQHPERPTSTEPALKNIANPCNETDPMNGPRTGSRLSGRIRASSAPVASSLTPEPRKSGKHPMPVIQSTQMNPTDP